MEVKNRGEKLLGNVGSSVRGMSWGEVNHLGKTVNKDSDGIETRGGARKMGNEVHRNGTPRSFWDGERLEKAIRAFGRGFVSLALGTGGNVFLHIFKHPRPEIVSCKKVIGNVL